MLNHNEEQPELVEEILKVLNEAELLNNLIFVGSWCIHFYRHHFHETFLEPIRTTDIDIDVNLLLKVKHPVSIPDLLEPLDFEVKFAGDNFIFLVHPALKIEFLSPEKGRNRDKPLRFLELLEKEVITTHYKGSPPPLVPAFLNTKIVFSKDKRGGNRIQWRCLRSDNSKHRKYDFIGFFTASVILSLSKNLIFTKNITPSNVY